MPSIPYLLGASGALAPVVMGTFVNNVSNEITVSESRADILPLQWRKKKNPDFKPTDDPKYDQGLNIVREFLKFAALHTVEDAQDFTASWVPHPSSVIVSEIGIPQSYAGTAATHIPFSEFVILIAIQT
jgi:hypothetical protein